MIARAAIAGLVLAVAGLAMAGCGARVVNVRDLRPTTAVQLGPLNGRVVMPLDVVIANELPDPVQVGKAGVFTNTRIEIRELAGFVDTHLLALLRRWFETVQVVASNELPSEPHLRMTIDLQRLIVEDARRPEVDPPGTIRAVLDWTAALRGPGGEVEYTFNDRVEGRSSEEAATVIENVLADALTRLQGELGGYLHRRQISAKQRAP